MAPFISSLLHKHPVSLKENLIKICISLGMKVDNTFRIAQTQKNIEECLKTYPQYEPSVRDIANGQIAEYRKIPATDPITDLSESLSNMELDQTRQIDPQTCADSRTPLFEDTDMD